MLQKTSGSYWKLRPFGTENSKFDFLVSLFERGKRRRRKTNKKPKHHTHHTKTDLDRHQLTDNRKVFVK